MDLTGLSTCSAAMTDPFCVGGGRRLLGSSKSGPGKEGSQNEVRLPVRHDPKLGKRGRAKVSSKLSEAAVLSGPPPECPAPGCQVAAWAPESLPRVGAARGPGFLS